jgi:hypothetical protein
MSPREFFTTGKWELWSHALLISFRKILLRLIVEFSVESPKEL